MLIGGVASLMVPKVYRRPVVVAIMAASGCLVAAGCTGGSRAEPADAVRVAAARRLMGVRWSIIAYAPDATAGRAAVAAAFAEVERLEHILSDYDPGSELSRLSASAPTPVPVRVGDDLWNVLHRAAEITALTDGAFDVTVGPLTTLWRQARRSGRVPRPEKLAAARAAVGPGGLVLDEERRTAALVHPGMRLDLGGIGMGYAADRALAVLASHGIRAALVDASGDVAVSAAPPGTRGWRVEVAGLGAADAPGGTLVLEHAAVTTSGDALQGVDIGGRRYSHVIDPRTGIGVDGPAAVTVIAPDGATADALATAASVCGPAAGAAAIARFPEASARFVWREAGGSRTLTTPGWPLP